MAMMDPGALLSCSRRLLVRILTRAAALMTSSLLVSMPMRAVSLECRFSKAFPANSWDLLVDGL